MITVVGGSAAATPTPAPDYSGLYGYVITTEAGVNLRLKPSGEMVVQVPRNVVVPCIGPAETPQGSSYTWYYVEYKGVRGYLRGDCVRVCDKNGDSIVVTPTPDTTNYPVVSGYGYIRLVKSGVNLRIRPGGISQVQLLKI